MLFFTSDGRKYIHAQEENRKKIDGCINFSKRYRHAKKISNLKDYSIGFCVAKSIYYTNMSLSTSFLLSQLQVITRRTLTCVVGLRNTPIGFHATLLRSSRQSFVFNGNCSQHTSNYSLLLVSTACICVISFDGGLNA